MWGHWFAASISVGRLEWRLVHWGKKAIQGPFTRLNAMKYPAQMSWYSIHRETPHKFAGVVKKTAWNVFCKYPFLLQIIGSTEQPDKDAIFDAEWCACRRYDPPTTPTGTHQFRCTLFCKTKRALRTFHQQKKFSDFTSNEPITKHSFGEIAWCPSTNRLWGWCTKTRIYDNRGSSSRHYLATSSDYQETCRQCRKTPMHV